MRRWKLALSLAVVAAIVIPGVAGTWRLQSGKWVSLTDSEIRRIEERLKRTKHCSPGLLDGDLDAFLCYEAARQQLDGAVWHQTARLTSLEYLTTNFLMAAGGGVLTFALGMVIPPIGRRYLAWLRR